VNKFTDHTRLGTTNNYRTAVNLNNSQITTAPAKHFPACYVFSSRSLATASNSGGSSISRIQVLPKYGTFLLGHPVLLRSDGLYVYDFIYATGCLDTEVIGMFYFS
jgi:hypothetical protein